MPAELRIVEGHRVITPAEEPEHFVPEPNGAEVDLEAVEFTRAVPACGNLSISEQQIWIGPKWAGRAVQFWADTVSVHVSLDGEHLKTVPSRFSTNSLHRLLGEGAVPAGPPPRSPAATGLRAADATLELERTVNGAGLVSLADIQFRVGYPFAGERVRIVLEGDVAHVVRDGVVVRSFACALPPEKRQRLQGARVAEKVDLRTEPLVVARRVSSSGVIRVGGQRVVVGSRASAQDRRSPRRASLSAHHGERDHAQNRGPQHHQGGEPLQGIGQGRQLFLGRCNASPRANP